MIYLHNYEKFPHAQAYGDPPSAFFDLRDDQPNDLAKMRNRIGCECCVFRYSDRSEIIVRLDYWILESVDDDPSDIEDKGKSFKAYALRGRRSERPEPVERIYKAALRKRAGTLSPV